MSSIAKRSTPASRPAAALRRATLQQALGPSGPLRPSARRPQCRQKGRTYLFLGSPLSACCGVGGPGVSPHESEGSRARSPRSTETGRGPTNSLEERPGANPGRMWRRQHLGRPDDRSPPDGRGSPHLRVVRTPAPSLWSSGRHAVAPPSTATLRSPLSAPWTRVTGRRMLPGSEPGSARRVPPPDSGSSVRTRLVRGSTS